MYDVKRFVELCGGYDDKFVVVYRIDLWWLKWLSGVRVWDGWELLKCVLQLVV